MRTTITIDDHVAAALKALARTSGKSFKTVVNEALQKAGEKPVPDQEAFKAASARRGFMPGIDPLKLNQFVDKLEVAGLAGQRHGVPHSNDDDSARLSGLTPRNPVA